MENKLVLPHGTVKLPAFFPDGTYGVVRCLDMEDLENCQVQGIVMNSYHLLTKPGLATIKALGGLHHFTGWHRPILTDSGGFQAFSLIHQNPKFGEIRRNEIVFRPDNSTEKIIFTPEKCIQAQFTYGSDIMMCLDYCTQPDDTDEVHQFSVEVTVAWAKRCKAEYFVQMKARQIDPKKRPLLFAIIQGGGSKELRSWCAEQLKQIGFDGYGFGGWPMDKDGKLIEEILRYTADLMPDETPKYAMGLGKPEDIGACIKMGYNLFDCVIPTREARHNRLYVFDSENESDSANYHYHYIMDDTYYRDKLPISADCDCLTCRRYSRAYLRHLYKVGDSLGYRLATLHNVRFYTQLMEKYQAEKSKDENADEKC